jgi:sugar/nucleoside kinase (ribokinase family)
LAYALSKNKNIKECLNIANQVAGLSTLKLGAGNSMPSLTDLK